MRNIWKAVSFVKRGKVRKEVLGELANAPATPTEVSKEIKKHRSAVSRAILDLEQEGLVKCLTPSEKLGRLYRATHMGQKVMEKIKR